MSVSDLLRETGLRIGERQFRRYLALNALDGIARTKGGHYYVVGPVTPERIERIRNTVFSLKRRPGRPPPRPSNRPKFSGSGGIATIEGVRGLFDLWANQVAGKWKAWPADKQERLFKEIKPIYEMGQWLKANNPILKLDDESLKKWLEHGVQA
ncbi:MAG TPA: hypothetical protein VIS96_12130 [Terrimicrobiaceae bacterium]